MGAGFSRINDLTIIQATQVGIQINHSNVSQLPVLSFSCGKRQLLWLDL